jgi:hypothetical protein
LTPTLAGAISAPVSQETGMYGRFVSTTIVVVLGGLGIAISCALEYALLKAIFHW